LEVCHSCELQIVVLGSCRLWLPSWLQFLDGSDRDYPIVQAGQWFLFESLLASELMDVFQSSGLMTCRTECYPGLRIRWREVGWIQGGFCVCLTSWLLLSNVCFLEEFLIGCICGLFQWRFVSFGGEFLALQRIPSSQLLNIWGIWDANIEVNLICNRTWTRFS